MNLPSTEQKADGSLWSKVTSLVAPGSLASQWGMKAIGMKDSAYVYNNPPSTPRVTFQSVSCCPTPSATVNRTWGSCQHREWGEKQILSRPETDCREAKKLTLPSLTSHLCPPSFCLGPFSHSAYEHAASIVSGWDFDRIIPCHGAVIESGGKHAWDSTFQKVLESGRARQAK